MATYSDIRFFENPFYNDETRMGMEASKNIDSFIDKDHIKEQVLETARIVFGKAQHGYGGLYTGAAGVTYAYIHILPILSDSEKWTFLPPAKKLYEDHMKYYEDLTKKKQLKEKDLVGLLSGKAGVDAVGAVLAKVIGDDKLQKTCVTNFANIAKVAKQLDFTSRGCDELFVGRAGYLCAILWMQKKLGFNYEPLPKEQVREIWNACILKGRETATQKKTIAPLLYSYHDKEYLGSAHGMSSILQMLLSFPDFCNEDPQATIDIKRTIDLLLELQDEHGNFPSSLGKQAPNYLVHWCHGASGIVYLLAKAYLVFNDPKYLRACVLCGEVVWERGLLKKGPGICHGVAGSGYVFLLLYRLLRKKDAAESNKYLFRAAKFAEFMESEVFKKYARTPDRPYSLFEGIGGKLCFLADLLHPDNAEFPFFDIWYNYKAT